MSTPEEELEDFEDEEALVRADYEYDFYKDAMHDDEYYSRREWAADEDE